MAGFLIFSEFHFHLSPTIKGWNARSIKKYKATSLDDAHFIIGALRVFLDTNLRARNNACLLSLNFLKR